MNKIDIAKNGVKIAVSFGTSKIVSSIIRNNVACESTVDTVSVAVTSLAIGSLVSDRLSEYTDSKIDKIVAFWEKAKTAQNQSA